MTKPKVIVTVRGGLVQSIHASSELLGEVEFSVLDYDNAENGDEFTEDDKANEGEIENKQLVEVY